MIQEYPLVEVKQRYIGKHRRPWAENGRKGQAMRLVCCPSNTVKTEKFQMRMRQSSLSRFCVEMSMYKSHRIRNPQASVS